MKDPSVTSSPAATQHLSNGNTAAHAANGDAHATLPTTTSTAVTASPNLDEFVDAPLASEDDLSQAVSSALKLNATPAVA